MNITSGSQPLGNGETFGVAACVDGVIAAFHTGASILQRTKEQLAARGAPPLPTLLEESIAQAPDEIEREKRRGIQRFGQQFEVGDYPAIFAIQQVTIQLQCSLLGKISNVDEEITDFRALARAADRGRDDTITTLIGLRQRLLQAEAAVDVSSLAISTSIAPLRVKSRETRDAAWSPTSATDSVISPISPERDNQNHRFDSWNLVSARNEAHRRDSSALSVQSEQHTISSNASTRATTMHPVLGGAADVKTSNPIETPRPNRKNNYLGFCKSAWKFQSGDDKAFVKSKDWTQSAQSTAYSLACSRFRCEFKSELKSSGNPSVIWNKVFVDELRGIKYRWSFLAKSHVTQKTVVNKDYSYQCLFCVFQSLQVPVMNLTALLEHISCEHRGSSLNDVILDRTGCVNGRICKDGEKFDINLYPTNDDHRAELYSPVFPNDFGEELMGGSRFSKNSGGMSDKIFELYAG